MRIFAAAALGLLLVISAGPARAFEEAEHDAIGVASYRTACSRLQKRFATDSAASARLQVFCSEHYATRYGQATRLSGDHVSSPDSFLENLPEGTREANSSWSYLELALSNESHFHPLSRKRWQSFHLRALDSAKRAAAGSPIESEQAFLAAFYFNAFGDHFLQDSFAAGHAGFARGLSSPNASKAFHDIMNERGRAMRNQTGSEWTAYGDGHYDEYLSPVLDDAAAASVESMLYAAVTGQVDNTIEQRALDLLPVEARALSWVCDESVYGYEHDDTLVGPNGDCLPVEGAWQPIDSVEQAAYVTQYFLIGLRYQRLAPIDDYGVRIDYDLVWLRPGLTVGYAHSDKWGPGFFLGFHIDVLPIRLAFWDSIFTHEVMVGIDGRMNSFNRRATMDDPDRARTASALTLTADLAYRVYLQTGAGYQVLWLEPAIAYGMLHESYEDELVRSADTRAVWAFGVSIGWGYALGVSGGGPL